MVNITNFIKYYILLYIIINIFIQQQNCYEFNVRAEKKESDLGKLNINNSKECQNLIPSLFYPILILHQNYDKGEKVSTGIQVKIPFLVDPIVGTLYKMIDEDFLNNFRLYYITNTYEFCYFGLSMNYQNETIGLDENQMILSSLMDNKKIQKKIFSFDKFILNNDSIDTILYLGEIHKDFSSNDGIIGTIKSNEEDNFWGFSFNEMSFNNKNLSLIKEDNKLYKIYLTTEDYDIKFPRTLIKDSDIGDLFDNKCKYIKQGYVECENFFNKKDYIPLKLMSKDINITLELDKFNRYYSKNNDNKERININLRGNFIIFPLIMFKQFHVQFDAEKKVINFYTKNSSLLQVKKEDHETPKNEEGSSSGLTTFLVILIILIIIGIGFGVFYFLRKRKNKVEKDINRFTKFEDEEDFKNMNENKVY